MPRFPLLIAAVAIAAPALADTLPLARGAYVVRGESCRSPANAFLQTYDGTGIGTSKAARCHARVIGHTGQRYTLRQSCIQYGDPGGSTPRATETLRLRIDSPTSYTDLGHGSSLRLCRGLKP